MLPFTFSHSITVRLINRLNNKHYERTTQVELCATVANKRGYAIKSEKTVNT